MDQMMQVQQVRAGEEIFVQGILIRIRPWEVLSINSLLESYMANPEQPDKKTGEMVTCLYAGGCLNHPVFFSVSDLYFGLTRERNKSYL